MAHPLDRLRGTIRRYVVVEGLLAAAVFLAGWFAVALAVDFGLFKLFTWDWVLDAPRSVRGVALVAVGVMLAALIALRIARRLAKELSYPALALVLERRYPKELGDRLITAVELADVEGHARYGYSGELIRQTIGEARERVARVPVNDVFNWRRLRVMACVAVGLVVLVVAVGYAAFVVATGSASPVRYGWRMAHVAGTFFDRNVLLQREPWPRRVHLELAGFDGDERRIGRDAQAPVVKARAYRWVIADAAAPMGWRPLAWGDLNDKLVEGGVPDLHPAEFRAAADSPDFAGDPAGWPLDAIQTGLDDPNVRAKLVAGLHPDAYLQLQNGLDRVFAALDAKAADPAMGRRLRKLDLPDKVTLTYAGQTKSGDVSLAPQQGQEFSAPVADLKESVRFVVRAEDFRTAPRGITLVPPPLFTKLVRTEYQPAYLYHAPPQDEGYPALAGRRQRVADKPVSLTGERSSFTVPSGTELVLTASADTDLTAAYVVPKVGRVPGAKPGSADPVPLPVADDRRTITLAFRGDDRLAGLRSSERYTMDADGWLVAEADTTATPTVEFDLVVEQADGVQARRSVLITVAEDQPPDVEIAVDAVRKVGAVYYVTPVARVPFNPESFVRDDRGLSKLAYEVTYWADESDALRGLRAQLVTALFLHPPAPASLPAGLFPDFHARTLRATDRGDAKQTGSFLVSRFEDDRAALRRETKAVFEGRLNEPAGDADPQVVTRVDLKSGERDQFDVKALKLGASVSEVQPRYRLDLNLVATDTNYDTGPRTGRNAETLRFLVVSEGDLLAEINKEEEQFAARLDEALAKLAGARKKWEYVKGETTKGIAGNNKDNVDGVRVRAADAGQDLAKAREQVRSIVGEYRRIHRECIVNVVTELTRDRFGLFANKLDRVGGETPAAVTEAEGRQVAGGQLQPRMTFPAAEKLVEAALDPLGKEPPQWPPPAAVSDAEQALSQLEREVAALRQELGELQSKEKLKKMLASVIEGQKRIGKELETIQYDRAIRLVKKEAELGAVGQQLVGKGESKKVKQAVSWNQYDRDELVVKLAVTDAAGNPVPPEVLAVSPELKLDFERNQLDFEYEVKAGGKDGEYTLTLTPQLGAPVKVSIVVR